MQDLNNTEFTTNNARQHQDVDIKFLFGKVFGNWYWYLIAFILFALIGLLTILFVSPHYTVT
ncbi:MAG: hypothetical protein ABJA35_04030, partial [Parafilimonas sp.]